MMRKPWISFVALAACSSLELVTPAHAGVGIGACYARGDVGYAWSDVDANASTNPFNTVIASGSVDAADLDDTWFGDIGIGCGLVRSTLVGGLKDSERWVSEPLPFRADITIGFRHRNFDGIPQVPPPPPGVPPDDPVSAELETIPLLFNFYYDLRNVHSGVTPYLGVAVGAAFHDLGGTKFTNGTTHRLSDESETDFAWGLMAGVGVDLGHNLILDLGYRYLDLGEVGVSNSSGFALHLDDLTSHEARLGVRYRFGSGD